MSRRMALLRDTSGVGAAEFALILPLLLLFLLGLIDAGRFMWEYNRAEKATQMGARYAVVTDLVPAGLADYSFAIDGGIVAGQPVPDSSFDTATCNDTTCTCTGTACSSLGYDAEAFANIVERMAAMHPRIESENVEVQYRNVGLGYSGDPNGPDVAPLVTVSIRQDNPLTFQPLILFGAEIGMPDFRAALTLEDGSGTVSN